MRIHSLRQRFTLFLLIPVAVILLGMGLVSFLQARNTMLAQWSEATVGKLRWGAHQVDMRLANYNNLIVTFNDALQDPDAGDAPRFLLARMRREPGVAEVTLSGIPLADDPRGLSGRMGTMDAGEVPMRRMRMGRVHASRIRQVTPPAYNVSAGQKTVSLSSVFLDEDGKEVGGLTVAVRFDHLMKDVAGSSWWQSDQADLIDTRGRVLASARGGTAREGRTDLFSPELLAWFASTPSGTHIGAGHPPREVVGFYRLTEAPWILVMTAPGSKVLSPILRFRNYYAALVVVFLAVILLIIRKVTDQTAAAIREVANAACRLADGCLEGRLNRAGADEIGDLVRSFNEMAGQLEDRMRMKRSLELAREVQASLLPLRAPAVSGLDLAGRCVYSDETGGDYFDFLADSPTGPVTLVVADVAEHGFESALLMAATRASLRLRTSLSGDPCQVLTDVNRQLVRDVEDSGRFVTMILFRIAADRRSAAWVSAGHEPVLVYDPARDAFSELGASGPALGLLDDFQYTRQTVDLPAGALLVLGTDGVREAMNPEGEMFGAGRLRDIVRASRDLPAEAVIDRVMSALHDHCRCDGHADDVTLIVARIT